MNTKWKCVASVLAVLAVAAGCGTDSGDAVDGYPTSPNTVTGFEREWKVVADHQTIKAGDVTFTFLNKGTIGHELLVIRTDLPVGKIPIEANGRFNEEGANAVNVGETGDLAVGNTISFKVKMAPGRYQLVCNLADHYKNGMYIKFTVD
ncbi:MAG: sulfocyanin-like copper-binding protein [Acidimicrobiales bacterium]